MWVQHGGEYSWLPHFAEVLHRAGVEVRFVATMKAGHEAMMKSGMASDFISPAAFDAGTRVDDDALAVLDDRFGPPHISQIAVSDLHLDLLFGNNAEKKHQVIARAYRFWEEYLRRNPADAFILRENATFATRTAMNVGRRLGIPVLRPDIGPDNDHFTIADTGEELMWSELAERLRQPPCPPTASERERVMALVNERTTSRFGRRFEVPRGYSRTALVRLILGSLREERRIDFARDPIAVAAQRTRRLYAVQRSAGHRLWRSFPYARPAAGERYVYLPLLFTREGTNLAVVPFWSQNLVALVREVATALPEGWLLYVKEHPLVPGDIPARDLWALRSIPRVRTIHPEEPSLDLVRDAGAVITFQGSVGWEAFLLKRPVIVIGGRPYYTFCSLVRRIGDIGEMAAALADAIRNGAADYGRREDEWYRFIHSVLESCPEGRYVMFEPPYMEMDRKNVDRVASAIAGKIHRAVDAARERVT